MKSKYFRPFLKPQTRSAGSAKKPGGRNVWRRESLVVMLCMCSIGLLPTDARAGDYRIIDLGTANEGPSEVVAMNTRGLVAGHYYDSSGEKHAFVWSGENGIVDLGHHAEVAGINEAGEVVGYQSFERSAAFCWSHRDGLRHLGHLGSGWSQAITIGDGGHVVGQSDDSKQLLHGFVWTKTEGMKRIGTLGQTPTMPLAVNREGVVVGVSYDRKGKMRAFRWSSTDGIQDLGLPALFSYAMAINEQGQIAGRMRTEEGHRAFVWDAANGVQDLGALGGDLSIPRALSDSGTVIGQASLRDGSYHAFRWTAAEGMQDLGSLGGVNSCARGINKAGQIVGCSQTAGGLRRAFVWTKETGMQALDSLGGELCRALVISDSGVIAGNATTDTGEKHACVWEPLAAVQTAAVMSQAEW